MSSNRLHQLRWAHLGLGLGAALVAALSGCGMSSGLPIACSGEAHCPSPSNSVAWALQLAPSDSTANANPRSLLIAQDQNRLQFDDNGIAHVQYRRSVLLSGSVKDATALPLLGARVIARLDSAIPGQNPYSIGTLTAGTPLGSWSLQVPLAQQPSSQPYRFWVGFDDNVLSSLYPPMRIDQNIGADTQLLLQLQAPATLAAITGRIIDALGDGVGDLTVQVFDSQNQIVSSTDISASSLLANAGNYRVLVDPALSSDPSGLLRVVVRPGAQSPDIPVLDSTLPPPRPGSETRVDFAIPSHRTPLVFHLPIRGTVVGSPVTPVSGAQVQAQVMLSDAASLKLGNRAYYTATAATDGQGIATLPLIPAPSGGSNLIYQVTINSPSQFPFASLAAAPVQVGPTAGLLGAVELPLRAAMRGRLQDPSGKPVAGATVMAARIPSTDPLGSPYSSMLVSADVPQGSTDSSGSFALNLDPGDYDLEFLPVAGTQARSSLDNQRMQSSDLDLGTITLPAVTLGVVQVTSPSGLPVADSKVRIFQLPDTRPLTGLACAAGLPCSRLAKLRAEAYTDQHGRAQILLPGGNPM